MVKHYVKDSSLKGRDSKEESILDSFKEIESPSVVLGCSWYPFLEEAVYCYVDSDDVSSVTIFLQAKGRFNDLQKKMMI